MKKTWIKPKIENLGDAKNLIKGGDLNTDPKGVSLDDGSLDGNNNPLGSQ